MAPCDLVPATLARTFTRRNSTTTRTPSTNSSSPSDQTHGGPDARHAGRRAVVILTALGEHEVEACVGGGWSVDALLGHQTREHSDLDLWLPAAHLDPLFRALAGLGVDRILPWPGDRPWNFVLHDGATTRVDLHLYEPIDEHTVHFGSFRSGETFPPAAFSHHGTIAGHPVTCEQPQWAVQWHTGYPPRPHDHHDVRALCDRFGLPRPDAYA